MEIRTYAVIYRAIEDLRAAMEGMLEPEEVEETLGEVEIHQLFKASRVGTIAGSDVTEGKVTPGAKARLVRDGTVVYDGEIASLRRFQDDVRRSRRARSAASCSRTSRTSRKATCSRSIATRKVERELE